MSKSANLKLCFLASLILLSVTLVHAEQIHENTNGVAGYLQSLLLPAIIASMGYILKSLFEVAFEIQKRRRNTLEEKLKNFYWPILTRLEENQSIWKLILKKHGDKTTIESVIAAYTEKNIVLKNHREIMSIIINNRYLAEFDVDLSVQLRDYFLHVAVYEGIIESKQSVFPGNIGASYPQKFDLIIKTRTEQLQKRLDNWFIF